MDKKNGYGDTAAKSQLFVGDWRRRLVYTRGENKAPDASLLNCIIALQLAPNWQNVFGYDLMGQTVVQAARAPWDVDDITEPIPWTDVSTIKLTQWLQAESIMVTSRTAREAVERVADENKFHPIRQYLDGLKWDQEPRLEKWLETYCGAERTLFIQSAGKKWMISAVARIFEPGCKADHMLIMEGEQGTGKSRAAEVLGGKWFTDEMPSLDNKDSSLIVGKHWIIEMAELRSMRRTMVETVKAFLSRRTDVFRPHYAREVVTRPRQCVFVGTTNIDEGGYLSDTTGNRRFWPVLCPSVRIDDLKRDRDQLWAEATAAYRAGEVWWLNTSSTRAAAAEEQEKRREVDPWTDLLEKIVADIGTAQFQTSLPGPGITLHEALDNLSVPLERRTRREELRVSAALKGLGWKKGKVLRLDAHGSSRYVRGFSRGDD